METYAQYSVKHCLDMIAPFEMPKEQEEGGQFILFGIIDCEGKVIQRTR